jgi:hypothetical protein
MLLMKKLFYIVIAIASLGCGREKVKPSETQESDEQKLRRKAGFYLAHVDLDEKGWIKETKCDGLLFNSLYSVAGGKSDPSLARGEPGVWYRHWMKDCYPKESASTISRDMFMGLLIWLWHNKRKDLLDEIIDYGENHANAIGSWVMGKGDIFAIGIRLEFQADFYEMRYRLGGHDHGKRKIPQIRFDLKGYEDHLQMLDIYLRALMLGSMPEMDFNAAKSSAKREPKNALFQAIYHRYSDGDYSSAIKILLDESIFPSDRMPSSENHCEMYLWQRDSSGKDWQPCPSDRRIFSAVDYLFAKAIILNEI